MNEEFTLEAPWVAISNQRLFDAQLFAPGKDSVRRSHLKPSVPLWQLLLHPLQCGKSSFPRAGPAMVTEFSE